MIYQDSVKTLFSFRLKEKLRNDCDNNDRNVSILKVKEMHL